VTVPQPPEEAFRLFTDEMAAWWPLATHSVGGTDATGLVFEQGVGGRIVETLRNGDTTVWGIVTVWDPPARVRFTWHPGTPEDEATDVEVTFTPAGAGTTVELVHSGWQRRPDGREARDDYDPGWDVVLEQYRSRSG